MNFSWSAHNKIYWKCIHVMCLCFGTDTVRDDDTILAMKGFLVLFALLLPNKVWGEWMLDFIQMKPSVKEELTQIQSLKLFLSSHQPQEVLYYIDCRKKPSVSLSEWSWMLHEYVNYRRIKNGEKIKGLTLSQFKEDYAVSKISKDQWGRPMWFAIHTFALRMPSELSNDDKLRYKAFMSSMQYVLPCPICKNHIKENLVKLDMTPYLGTNVKLFEWTVKLHNTVNSDNNKSVMSLSDALQLYNTKDTSTGSANGLLERLFL